MCDSLVVVAPGQPVWLGKNSDRAPDEVQLVERHPAAEHPEGGILRATHVALAQARATAEVILSRPRGMWGCEMGVSARGVAIANEAVFARLPPAERGLTGMDLQRLALERAGSAADALEILIALLARHPQGGPCDAHDHLRYSSSFLIADAGEAWVLETAGELWAAQRVSGVRTISNAYSIDADFDRIHPRAFEVARARGLCRGAADFGFARCFASPFFRVMSGGEVRRACTRDLLTRAGALGPAAIAAVLRDHGGRAPHEGWRMLMPCAHASWLPTRTSGQTTASMIVRLDADGPRVWATGTSSPCLSVFKLLAFGADAPGGEALWWRHERLHRLVLAGHAPPPALAEARARLEARAWAQDPGDAAAVSELWREHHEALATWLAEAQARPGLRPFRRFWARKGRALRPE